MDTRMEKREEGDGTLFLESSYLSDHHHLRQKRVRWRKSGGYKFLGILLTYMLLMCGGNGGGFLVVANSMGASGHHHDVLESCAVESGSKALLSSSSASSSLHSSLGTNGHHAGFSSDGLRTESGQYRRGLASGLGGGSGSESGGGAGGGGGGDIVLCQIRTLHSDLDFENLTQSVPIDMGGVTKLGLQCNDVLFFESHLEPGQLTGFSALQELRIEKCKLKFLGSESLQGLGSLRSLSVQTRNSDWAGRSLELSGNVLESVPQLRELNLGYNDVWNLPDGLLCQVGFLQSLNLTHNLLSDIDDLGLPEQKSLSLKFPGVIASGMSVTSAGASTISTCLGELKSLDLSFNALRSLGGNRLERLKRLNELRLDHNWLEEISGDAFAGLSQLRNLNFSSNRLVALPPNLFKPTKGLRELDLRNNSLTTLSEQLLEPLEHLQVLDISINSLSTISGDALKGLVRLVILNLAHNKLTSVAPSTFKDLYTLQVLDLSFNQISSIQPASFMTLSNLHSLNLRKNQLTTIGSSMFDGLYVLHKLILDYNNIESMDAGALKNCTSLQDLGLVGNQLEHVPTAALSSLRRLRTLDLGENKITTLSNSSFSGLSQLYGLRLVDNQIEDLPRGLCEPIGELRVLNAAQNKIRNLGLNTFVGCIELRVLRLDSNKLEILPTTLPAQLPNLLWFNVSENQLRRVDYSLLPPTLEWLDVSHNLIEFLSGIRHYASAVRTPPVGHHHRGHNGTRVHLRVVDASYNSLTTLDHHAIPPSLEILRLNHNKLKKISADALSRGESLRRVELVGNQLETIHLNALRLPVLPGSKPLPEFLLGGNPFLCDCDMEWLTRINHLSTLRSHPTVLDLDSIICRLSYSRSGGLVALSEMKSQDFLCPYKSHCFALCHCCDFDACDCAMTCPENCTCYHDDTWSANVVDCSRSSQNGVPDRLPMDSTEVYLDGNNIPMLKSHTFIGRKNLKVLYLNNSVMSTISNKSFNGLQSLLTLHLDDNRLSALHGYEFDHLIWLRELFLQNNRIRTISNNTFLPLKSLEILRLDGNQLAVYSVWQLGLNPYLVEIGLAGNPWDCGCEFLHQLHSWVADNSKKIIDLGELRCTWNGSRALGPFVTDYNATCGSSWALIQGNYLGSMNLGMLATPGGILASLLTILLLLTLFLALMICCWEAARVWIFTHCGIKFGGFQHELDAGPFPCCCCSSGLRVGGRGLEKDEDKSYDAYLLYSQKDEEFINNRIGEELETNDNYRLCLHHRDLVNESGDLGAMMWGAVESSKMLIVLLSRNFFQGEWSSGEGQNAFLGTINKITSGYRSKSKRGSTGNGAKPILFIETERGVANSPEIVNILNRVKSGRGRGRSGKVLQWSEEDEKKFWPQLKFYLPQPSSHYHSNITSNTTSSTSGASSTDAGGKYSTMSPHPGPNPRETHPPNNEQFLLSYQQHQQQQLLQQHGHYAPLEGSSSNGKPSWPSYPASSNFHSSLPPPKYPPPPVSPRTMGNKSTSPPSNSTDSTTAEDVSNFMMMMMTGGGGGAGSNPGSTSGSSASYYASGHIQPNNQSSTMKSPLPSHRMRNTNPVSSAPGSGGTGESYLSIEGEHVYSSLDPPSPQQPQPHFNPYSPHQAGTYPQQMLQQHSFLSPSHAASASKNQGGGGGQSPCNNFMSNGHPGNSIKNIHLPNGYTYSPSPKPQPQWHPHPSFNSGTATNGKSRAKNNNQSNQESVQTYLV